MPGETEETRKRFKSKPSKSKSTSKPSGGGGSKMRSDDPRGERGQSTTKKEIKKVQKAVKEAAKEDRTAQAYIDRWDEGIRSTKAAEEFKPTKTQLEDVQAVKGVMGTSVALTGFAKKKAFLDARGKKGDPGYETLEEWMDSLSKRDRQRVRAADDAGLFGGGTQGGREAFQRGTGQSEYQMMMDRIRTGELGPAMEDWYQGKFPGTYNFMRGMDVLGKGGIYGAALRSMTGADQELLPYDRRKDWYDELGTVPIDPYGTKVIKERGRDPDWDDITNYQKYKLQSQIQERGGFTGGKENKLQYAKQMGIVPLDWTYKDYDYIIGSESVDTRFPGGMIEQPITESELDQYLAGLDEFSPTPVEGGILQSPEAIAEYNRAKRLYDMGADPVTGGARMELDKPTQEIAYSPGGGGGGTTPPGDTTPPDDETPPGDENQWATASPGQIGWMDEFGNYNWGTMGEYSPYADVNLQNVRDGGIIGLDGGGYINDYQAADSLMFKDPQEDEEWEYNV